MAINKKLISFATQAQFDAYLANNNIDPRSIVFIEDKKRIWTHGVFFDTSWDYVTGKPDTYTPSAHTLGSHSDVTLTALANGDILKYNGSKWVNNTLAQAGIATPADISTAINTTLPTNTKRDFTNGTLVTTSIDYSVTNGNPFYMTISGNSYGRRNSVDTVVQGYIYNNTIINYGVTHKNPQGITGIVAMNVGGKLCFWFPRQTYWEGYSIMVTTAHNYNINTITGITDVAKPAGTKEVNLSSNTKQAAFHNDNLSNFTDNIGIASHIANKSNPHAVTKAQVGLGNVLNVASYSKTESDGKYLQLVGGTITGSSYNMLELKRSSANGSSILFSNSSVNLGKIGFTSNGNLIIGTGASTDGTANMLSITPSGIAQFYGNISTSGLVTGTGFSKTGATDEHVLLGSGGHKAISDFVPKQWTGAGDGAEIWMKSDVTTAGHSLGLHFTNSTNSTTAMYQSRIQSRRGSGNYSDLIFSIRDTDIMLEILGQDRRVNILNQLTVQNNEVYHSGNLNPVTTNTAQDISGTKTFNTLRSKKVTLMHPTTTNAERGIFEYMNGTSGWGIHLDMAISGYGVMIGGTADYIYLNSPVKSGNIDAGNSTITAATFSGNASSASKVNNKLTLKFDTGTTENTNLYTYDGSAAKTIDIKAGSNVSLTKSANTITINATDTNTTYSAMSVAEGTAGTATSLRTMRADYLKQIIQHYDTNSVTGIRAGASETTTNATATDPYIKVIDDNTYRSQIRLIGSGATTVSSDASGNITISSTDSNTTYSTGTLAQLNAGTDTTGRLQTAKLLNDWLNPKLDGKLDKSGGTLTGSVAGTVFTLDHYIPSPQGGRYTTSTNTMTGAIKITLPLSWNSTMLRFAVDVYNYSTNTSFTVYVGGYNYSGSSTWINTFAYILARDSSADYTVRFGHDGSKCCVYIGETNKSWSYPQIVVRDVHLGYSGGSHSSWGTGWSIGFATSFGTITSTISDCMVYSRYAKTAGSVAWGNVTEKPSTFAPSTHTHSNISITAGTGLSGGGALSESRTLSIASTYAPNTSTSLGASKNLNDYQTAGFYHQTANANATTALNYPVASAGSLLVQTAAGVIQTYKVYNSSDVYVRGYYNSAWSAWRKLALVTDNVASATKLQTARTINGTSFNGTASITTANWGTARTLTIGNTGKSVNGSANVSWSLSEIGAASASHTHSYLPLSGGTLTGDLSIRTGNTDKYITFDYAGNDTYNWRIGYLGTGSGDANYFTIQSSKSAGGVYFDALRLGLETLNAQFFGTVTAPTFIGALTGNASSATKLQTARTIAGVSFNGTANINIPFANLSSKPTTLAGYGITDAYTKAEVDGLAKYIGGYSYSNGFLVKTNVARTENSMLVLHIKGNSYGGKVPINTLVQVYNYVSSDSIIQTGALNNGYEISEVKVFYYNNLVYFWVPQQTNFMTMTFQLLKAEGQVNRVTSVSNSAVPTTGVEKMVTITPRTAWFKNTLTKVSQLSNDSGYITASASITGNAATATKLQTARTINGTNFDGSANITTANWGTARTITIGNTGKSVNGSANVSWSLSEIGAAPVSHTHSYLPLSGGTLTGVITSPKIRINKAENTASGISWYNSTYNAWQDYMANSGTTGNGVNANITAPSGTLVTTWARRSFIEGTAGYGWTFEKGTNSSTTPSVVAEIRASDGAAKFGGNVTAPTFVGALSGNASTATKLQTARTIAGVSFDGSANIAIPFANLSSKPTTLSGYGITDAVTLNTTQTITGAKTFTGNVLIKGAAADSPLRVRGIDGYIDSTGALDNLYLNYVSTKDISMVMGGGNVGIGTTSPAYKLDVAGTGRYTGVLTLNNGLNINVATAGDGGWSKGIIVNSTSSTAGEATVAFTNTSTGANHWITGLNQSIDFDIAYGTTFSNAATKLRITAAGSVGIGTISPASILDVAGTGRFKGLNITAPAGTTAITSNGNHVFNVRSGETWNAPGVLGAIVVRADNKAILYRWSISPIVLTIGTYSGGFSLIHNLGHAEYVAVVTHSSGNGGIRVANRTTTKVDFTAVNVSGDNQISVILVGRNKI